jgi:hypothetical protein
MKTITGFLATENNYRLLTINELITVKGGDDPSDDQTDPFKKKQKSHRSNSWAFLLSFIFNF